MDPLHYEEDDSSFESQGMVGEDVEAEHPISSAAQQLAIGIAWAAKALPNTARVILWVLLGAICLYLIPQVVNLRAIGGASDLAIGLRMGSFSLGAWWSFRKARDITPIAWLRRILGVISVLAFLFGCLVIWAGLR